MHHSQKVDWRPKNLLHNQKTKEIKLSGGGALLGMVIGVIVGLSAGPTWVIIGGLAGAIIGNAAEYVSIQQNNKKVK